MRIATVLSVGFCAALAGAALASASRYLPLDATYAITGESFLDPDPDEKKDRLTLYFQGDAARQVYEAMPGPGERIVCNPEESSARKKSAGGFSCSGDEKSGYQCGVAIKLDDGTTDNAFAC